MLISNNKIGMHSGIYPSEKNLSALDLERSNSHATAFLTFYHSYLSLFSAALAGRINDYFCVVSMGQL